MPLHFKNGYHDYYKSTGPIEETNKSAQKKLKPNFVHQAADKEKSSYWNCSREDREFQSDVVPF